MPSLNALACRAQCGAPRPSPKPLTLDDLDRAELLALIRRVHPFGITPRDLWRVRWDVLSERASAAGRDVVAAADAYTAAPARSREAAWAAYQRASDRAKRAHAASDRAYAALEQAR